MRILKKGMMGDDVSRWQNFLRGIQPDSVVTVTSTFDDVTFLETKRFQRANALRDDGDVGPMTLSAALRLGFHFMEDDGSDESGPNWPPPSSLSPLTSARREKLFDKFTYVSAPTQWNPETIEITDFWPAYNIETVLVPQLIGVSGAPKDGKVQFNKHISQRFVGMFADWERAGLKDRILTWGGSWVPRFIRGSRTALSNHSWGTAFDINVQWNGLGMTPALKGQKGSVRELVNIANDHGVFWGGHWKDRPDGMHWEIAEL